jgi:hypothetical protein
VTQRQLTCELKLSAVDTWMDFGAGSNWVIGLEEFRSLKCASY